MSDREKVIHAVETAFELWIDEYTGCSWFKEDEVRKAKESAIKLLKEQDNEKKRIMKVIWDTLHEGLSIDTVADQDWVYERIRHRIEDT